MKCEIPGLWLSFTVGDIYVTLSDAPSVFSISAAKTVATLARHAKPGQTVFSGKLTDYAKEPEQGQTVVVSGKVTELLRRLSEILGTATVTVSWEEGVLTVLCTSDEWVEVRTPCVLTSPFKLPLPREWYRVNLSEVVREVMTLKQPRFDLGVKLAGSRILFEPSIDVWFLKEPAREKWEVYVKARDFQEAWRAFEAVKAEPREVGCADGRIFCLRSTVHGAELIAWIAGRIKPNY